MGSLHSQRSIARKLAVSAVAVIGLGAALTITVQEMDIRDALLGQARQQSLATAQLLATGVAGGVRWGQAEAIERAYGGFIERNPSDISDLAAFDRDGRVIASHRGDSLRSHSLESLPRAVLDRLLAERELVVEHTPYHLVVHAPVIYGRDAAFVGALSVAYSTAGWDSAISALVLKQSAMAAAILAAVVVVLMVLLRRLLVIPLRAMTEQVMSIAEAEGDLTRRLELERDDELGLLAAWMNALLGRVQETGRAPAPPARGQADTGHGAAPGMSAPVAS